MEAVVVYKPDGTIQCESGGLIPLAEHAQELLQLGASRICGQTNVAGPNMVIDLCGAPTGKVNAFAIPKEDWEGIISRGILGPMGFRAWIGVRLPPMQIDQGCELVGDLPQGPANNTVNSLPVLIRELVGRLCRCYKRGDSLTRDFRPERVNVEHDDNGRITDIWFG